jgi:hypothetical protein
MPKVTMPLGSDNAHGHVGDLLVFQGNTVKAFRTPRNPKTPAQTSVRDRMQSVTKMILAMKPWARGCLQGMLGVSWYGLIYKSILQGWNESEAYWLQMWSGEQETWVGVAPYRYTRIDPDMTFFICYRAIVLLCEQNGYNWFGVFVEGGEAAMVLEWWTRSIENVFYAGKYDDNNADFEYSAGAGVWDVINDGNAYGGSYHRSNLSSMAMLHFTFYGRKFGILYHQIVTSSAVSLVIDNSNEFVFSQNSVEGLYQVEWQSELRNRGIHTVDIWRSGANGSINIDGVVIYG